MVPGSVYTSVNSDVDYHPEDEKNEGCVGVHSGVGAIEAVSRGYPESSSCADQDCDLNEADQAKQQIPVPHDDKDLFQ